MSNVIVTTPNVEVRVGNPDRLKPGHGYAIYDWPSGKPPSLITVVNDFPVLVAINEAQAKNWRGASLVAVPITMNERKEI